MPSIKLYARNATAASGKHCSTQKVHNIATGYLQTTTDLDRAQAWFSCLNINILIYIIIDAKAIY